MRESRERQEKLRFRHWGAPPAAVDRMVMLIEKHAHGLLIVGIVGNEQVTRIPQEYSLRIEGLVLLQDRNVTS